MLTSSIVTWATLVTNPGWDRSRNPKLRGISKIQNRPGREFLYTFGSQTFVPISWMCKTQSAVSHSSTESEVIFSLRFSYGRCHRSRSLGFDYRSDTVLIPIIPELDETRCIACVHDARNILKSEIETYHVGRNCFNRDSLFSSERKIFSR